MSRDEMKRLQALAGRANYLARLRDQGRMSESDYIERLNEVRREYGLWPLQRPPQPGTIHPRHRKDCGEGPV